MSIAIILSTYNGAEYLPQLLDSLLQQTIVADTILIRDDGSTDTTPTILDDYATRYANIKILDAIKTNLGINPAYKLLMQHCLQLSVDYIMFADQDDIWLPHKTARLLAAIQKLPTELPALVFSDVTVVDSNLKEIAPSYLQLQKIAPQHAQALKALLLYSPALGCTMLFNRQLLELAANLPANAPNPDKWTLMLAAIFGKVDYITLPTVLYRQHADNVTGCTHKGIRRKLIRRGNLNFIKTRYQSAITEARLLLDNFNELPAVHQQVIKQFIIMFTGAYTRRISAYIKFSGVLPTWKRKAGLFCSLLVKYN